MTTRKSLSLDFLKPVLELEYEIQQLRKISKHQQVSLEKEISFFRKQLSTIKYNIFQSLTPLQRLHLVRQADRPTTLDYMPYIMNQWLELHGDRGGKDDPALVGGIGKLDNHTVIFVGHQRGKDTKDNVLRNFGMASPGGYRKALRLMQHANQFNFPILTFIDTPGAWAGIDAEKLGQGEAIAVNLREMFSFDVPIICTILGEGGSGGALGIGIGDKILMLEYAVYTVATPEACAAILWKDSKRSLDAAEALKITSADLKILGIIDEIVKEPVGGSQSNPYQAGCILKESLIIELNILAKIIPSKRKELRYNKFRKIGTFYEGS
uniref:Acetyl-coenzyme A carboxylase carboxyl transferase subunit alpha n=1 Tax=Gracilaria vermiculophylla TaxID=2608709 RepID=A0A345U8U8_9FLOR|nr:acetyl-CoA carboxylase, carboxyl transferase subunit alpha [Gracilaria vermiculophylla]AXI96884.1 acetyl-CoA carboxylase, carboxyl transferase subunit alpha [Gracilaria vermiculophylla]QXU75097.1 acetyl-CoA carboxylase, carboxyl transferase subunit alpha [Gracilaria vermiculophylla]WDZ67916.1 acetyl-CoA carboxylase, carboxyl transferase subunit alpha [Gracilaria vermiculophylla]